MLSLLAASSFAQAPAFPANGLKVKWEVVENGYQGKPQTLSTFTLINKTKQALPASGWAFYFTFVRYVTPGENSAGVEVAHVNGPLFNFRPLPGFKGIAPGDSLKVNIISGAWVTAITDGPEGPYIVWDRQPGKGYALTDFTVVPPTQAKQLRRTAADDHPQTTAAEIYARNALVQDVPLEQLPKIFPTPAAYEESPGAFVLDANTTISYHPDYRNEAACLATVLSEALGRPVRTEAGSQGRIRLEKAAGGDQAAGAYTLTGTQNGYTISAAGAAGIFYGVQSLRSMLPAAKSNSISIPLVTVKDVPRFGFRSLMLDVARNFHSKQQVMRVLDVMALYKLNVLHLHMSDDEGWRVEISGLPELTGVGGRRAHGENELEALQPAYGSGPDVNNTSGTGFYTRADYMEILRYAALRHIKVIPEIEMPGHARAAIKSMDARHARLMKEGKTAEADQYRLSDPEDKSRYRSVQEWKDNVINVALPSTYTFLEKVVDELVAMHREAGAPLDVIHMGGDETPAGVWEKSPACAALIEKEKLGGADDLWYYFYDKVASIVNQRGLQLYGWEEAGMRKTRRDGRNVMIANPGFAARNFQLDVWNNVMGEGMEDLTYRLANGGYKVVLSGVSNYYFDMAYVKDYYEPGFYWGGYVDVDKPFYFIPFDMYKNAKEDGQGRPLPAGTFVGKDRLTEYGRQNIVGIQAALWSETVKTPAQQEYLLLPKLLGMAERAWAPNPAWAVEKDDAAATRQYQQAWSNFANIVGKKELPRLARLNGGYQYRIPTAGAVVENGKVLANVQLPGMVIRYTVDGKEPTVKSPVYTAPVDAGGVVKLKVFDSVGRGGRTVAVRQ
jgi:hexosaminidase